MFKEVMPIYTHKQYLQTLVLNNTTMGYIWMWKQVLLPQVTIYCPVKKQKSFWLSVLWPDQIIDKVFLTFTVANILSWSFIYNFVIFISVSQFMFVFKDICKQSIRLWIYLNYLLSKDSLWKLESWFSKFFSCIFSKLVPNNANLAEYS